MEPNNKEIKRRSTFSLLFYINRTKVRKDGTCKLLCKVSIDAKSAPININAFVEPSLWNPETKRANGRSENARTVNLAIEIWGIERSGFFNGREKWAKGFENQRV